MKNTPANLLAVDVGNSRVKLGWFPAVDPSCAAGAASGVLPLAAPLLPEPADTLGLVPDELAGETLRDWLEHLGVAGALPEGSPRALSTRSGDSRGLPSGSAPATLCVALASVSSSGESAVVAALSGLPTTRLTSPAAPIELRVDEPERIGVDRVLAAVAANRLRRPGRAAIVIDVGTAITVDLVSAEGALEGGAILPGPGLAARALGEKTDALPDIRFGELDDSPDAVGRSTEPAIRAGVFWGSVGAIRELIARQRDRLTEAPQVLLTGGAAPSIARLIGGPDLSVRCVPHLVLSGIAIAASEAS